MTTREYKGIITLQDALCDLDSTTLNNLISASSDLGYDLFNDCLRAQSKIADLREAEGSLPWNHGKRPIENMIIPTMSPEDYDPEIDGEIPFS